MAAIAPEEPVREVAESKAVRPKGHVKRRAEGTAPGIADHEILRIIGTGAYGEVWLARSLTGAYRAVKVVWREDFEDERSFIREFEGVLQYEPVARNNPGLAHVLHVGRHEGENPCYYYVMELADDAYTGIHIEPKDYVPRTLRSDMQLYGLHPMPLDYVLEVGSQLAHALAGLHEEELTHRDVKPGNIIFVNSRAKLADAGLVAHNSKRSFVGTEGYIPPDGPGTPRADVYALAKVLYEMSTGKDRLDFPELPAELPEGTPHKRWMAFNELICAAAAPIVGKNSIVAAAEFAEKLDELKNYRTGKRKKRSRPLTGKNAPGRTGRIGYVLLGLALLVALGSHFLPDDFGTRLQHAIAVLRAAPPGEPAATPPPENAEAPPEKTAPAVAAPRLLISTTPAGASIYTESGAYVGETPYGPLSMTAGKRVAFVLRKAGYMDTHCSAVAPADGLLKLGGTLTPFRPPHHGMPWQDAQGTSYAAKGNIHTAATPVTVQCFEEFVNSAEEGARVPYERMEGTEYIRTTRNGIGAYILWLTKRCVEGGTIGNDHSLQATPEPGTERNGMQAYRLSTGLVLKTSISIYTNPAGATVMLNGRTLGITPMQAVRVPLAPYLLEIRHPGYSTIRKSGLNPRGLVLNLTLSANNSVVFGAEWINSLGQKLVPLAPTLLAGATEVRIRDYLLYCERSGKRPPQAPLYSHNEHHPVVNISRGEAQEFARWLTETEQALGLIEASDFYRLPTDAEWSAMAGLQQEKGASPYERDSRRTGFTEQQFTWGNKWPPMRDSGNFADTSAQAHVPQNLFIEHYRDGFPYSAPVGSFRANGLGLHDLSGNVQEWVSDAYGSPAEIGLRESGVVRGGDYTSFSPNQLNTAHRTPLAPEERIPTVGFRLMLERHPSPL